MLGDDDRSGMLFEMVYELYHDERVRVLHEDRGGNPSAGESEKLTCEVEAMKRMHLLRSKESGRSGRKAKS
jgi:hypothetical protein